MVITIRKDQKTIYSLTPGIMIYIKVKESKNYTFKGICSDFKEEYKLTIGKWKIILHQKNSTYILERIKIDA